MLSCQASARVALRALGAGDDLNASPGALHLTTAVPSLVWLDHLLPRLTLRETVMLRATCRAMRAIVADVRAHLKDQRLRHLKDLLTCFPKAQTIEHDYVRDPTTPEEQDSLIAWLKGRSNSLTFFWSWAPIRHRAWRAGIFKTVKDVYVNLQQEADRDLIIDGFLTGVESISVWISTEAPHVERAALGYLRNFPAPHGHHAYYHGQLGGGGPAPATLHPAFSHSAPS
jgi:hypothetical protein